MQIDVISDTVCPWCFIGKRRLERALAERPQADLTIRWRPFQLNPEMPVEGLDRQTYLGRKFGGPEGAQQVYARIRAAGESEGIAFDFDAIGTTPNSMQSHRLIAYAGRHGLQDSVVEGLFRAYFTQGRDIGQKSVLEAVGTAAGLETESLARYLETDEDLAALRAEDLKAREAGIQGVPTFILNGRYALSGAQPPEVLFQLFDLAREAERNSQAAG